MGKTKLSLAMLWHQHQPYYKNSQGIFQMPWVRFHGTKDYLDLLLVLKEFPTIKQNYNLVPSLIEQIQDYVNNGARDSIWELTEKAAVELDDDEKIKILDHFFLANINTMIKPYGRYYELYLKYKRYIQSDSPEKNLTILSSDDYRDLQVWYNLSWIGMESRKQPEIDKLFKKGKNFTESDKKILLKESENILSRIIPTFKELWSSKQVELSTSPFYHPILPLVCNTEIGRESAAYITLPNQPFAYPDDAEAQVERGLRYFEDIFGRKPAGMWPSEGSVSFEALDIISRHGISWVATDENILANTLGDDFSHTKIYQPYLLNMGNNSIHIFFRDHYLSDAIGFVYSNWTVDQAVEDLMGRLYAIYKLLIEKHDDQSLHQHVVSIILDGENCWEYYEGDGKPFLRKLYQAIAESDFIESVTLSEALSRVKKPEQLTKIFPGSWINGNFNIWIGSEEDNKSWEILAQTRQFLEAKEREGIYPEQALQQAWERIYIAEGSDWNWWYGDEHSSGNDLEFDSLYREHLMEVYRLLDSEIPSTLYQTIKRVRYDKFVSTTPKNFIYPTIDGKSSYFYEWVGAAIYDVGKISQTSMHQVTRIMDQLFVGFDHKNLYLRLDFLTKPDPLLDFIISIKRPKPITVVISPLRGVVELYQFSGELQKKSSIDPIFKLDKILEFAISFHDLNVHVGDIIGFQVYLKLNGKPLEEFPRMNLVEIEVPTEEFEMKEWSV
jgi:alpha-amylase/alpha-mannosidase (GH57 family)